jgi:hypothetical protein
MSRLLSSRDRKHGRVRSTLIRGRTFAVMAASAALIAGCGGSAATTTTTAGRNDKATSKARLARKQERQHLIAEGRQVVGCLHQAGYRRVVHQFRNNTPFFSVRRNGVVAPIVDRSAGPPVVKTGLQTTHGAYVVGIASNQQDAFAFLGVNLGFPGGSAFDGSYDGSVTVISSGGGNRAAYESERATVAACAFSVPGASGHPKPAPKRFR